MSDCCQSWKKARETGTDNEQYGAAVHDLDDDFLIGTGLLPIAFCPWCGAKKTEPNALEKAAKAVVDATYGKRREWEDLKAAIGELAAALEKDKT